MTVQYTTWSAICPSVSESTFANCSGRMKRAATSSTTEDALEPKKRKVMYSTYEKWRRDFDHECKTVTWLGCETTEMARGKRWVKWISGADSPRTNNISDHAHSDQFTSCVTILSSISTCNLKGVTSVVPWIRINGRSISKIGHAKYSLIGHLANQTSWLILCTVVLSTIPQN